MGFKSYKWNNTTVLRKCGWLGGTHLIYFSTLCFIHKINFDMQPISLVEKFIYRENRGSRYTRCPFKTKYDPKSKITKEGLFSKGLLFYKKILMSWSKKLIFMHFNNQEIVVQVLIFLLIKITNLWSKINTLLYWTTVQQ